FYFTTPSSPSHTLFPYTTLFRSMHIGSLPAYIRGFMRKLAGQIYEGDIIIHNHPYHGASHSPDMGVIAPIFHRGELVGFAAATRSEEHTSELQSRSDLVCRLLLE